MYQRFPFSFPHGWLSLPIQVKIWLCQTRWQIRMSSWNSKTVYFTVTTLNTIKGFLKSWSDYISGIAACPSYLSSFQGQWHTYSLRVNTWFCLPEEFLFWSWTLLRIWLKLRTPTSKEYQCTRTPDTHFAYCLRVSQSPGLLGESGPAHIKQFTEWASIGIHLLRSLPFEVSHILCVLSTLKSWYCRELLQCIQCIANHFGQCLALTGLCV